MWVRYYTGGFFSGNFFDGNLAALRNDLPHSRQHQAMVAQ